MPIKTIAKKHGIKVVFHSSEEFSYNDINMGTIHIYTKNFKGKAYSLFYHLRNAFAHMQIQISDGRCVLLDWKAYNEKSYKQHFSEKLITMFGIVDYANLKMVIDDIVNQLLATDSNPTQNKQS